MHRYYVKSAEHITRSTLLLTLEKDPDETRLLSFQPGQYAAISFKRNHRPSVARCFSIVSSPTEQTTLQFAMRTRGKYTSALSRLEQGDEVDVRGPFGGFIFDVERDRHAVFVAGGIGITPFMSMMQYATAIGLKSSITVLYGVASQDDIPFLDELKLLREKNPYLKIIYVVGNGPTDSLHSYTYETGFVNEAIIDKYAGEYGNATYFACGPPPFMNGVLKTLKKHHVPKDRIITEAFSQGPNRQTGKVISWPQNMYILGGVGMALGTLAIAVSDVVKSLPHTSFVSGENALELVSDPNKREEDLDSLVNEMPVLSENRGTSVALTNVLKKVESAKKNAAIAQRNTNSNNYSVSPSNSLQQSSGITSSTGSHSSAAKITPTPVPQPVCTTSQSGVVTCN